MSQMPHPHPARALDNEHRRRYLFAVAAIVYADGKLDPNEVEVLRVLAEAVGLPADVVDETVGAVRVPDRGRIDEILGELPSEDVRLAMLADAILVTYADGKVSADECKEISEYAERLGISTAQAVLVGRYVEEAILAEEGHGLSKALAEGLADARAQLHQPRGLKWLYRKLTEHRLPATRGESKAQRK